MLNFTVLISISSGMPNHSASIQVINYFYFINIYYCYIKIIMNLDVGYYFLIIYFQFMILNIFKKYVNLMVSNWY